MAVFGPPPKALPGPRATGVPRFTLDKYTKHMVVRFNVSTAEETSALTDAIYTMFLDVWASAPGYIDVRVRKADFDGVLSLLPESLASSYSTLMPDLVSLAAATYPSSSSSPVPNVIPQNLPASTSRLASLSEGIDNAFFKDYQPVPVVDQWMRLVQAMFPTIVRMVKVGTSYEGRDINGLKIGTPPPNTPSLEPRKTILVTGGLHAREWISTTSVNYAAWGFIAAYDRDRVISKMLQAFDIIFIPAMNPDGVVYTWERERLWRKSRQHTNMRWCRGFDLDRAFGFKWGLRSEPCSENYGGEEPFQAVEAVQFSEWAKNQTLRNNVQFVGLLDLHSYSQQVLYPYSYTCAVDPPNLENLEELGTGLVKAIRLASREPYTLGPACEGFMTEEHDQKTQHSRVETGGGSFMDWAFHELKVHYSFRLNLRDTGNYGFLLPREYIVPTGEEVFSAIRYFGDFLMGNNGIEVGYKDSRLGELKV